MYFRGCPKFGGTILGVLMIKIRVDWGLYWYPLQILRKLLGFSI